MAYKGSYTKSREWGKHLKDYKTTFQRAERRGAKEWVKDQIYQTMEAYNEK